MLDDRQCIAFAAWIAGMKIVEFQLCLVNAALSDHKPSVPRLRLVSDLHGIAIDPDFIKEK